MKKHDFHDQKDFDPELSQEFQELVDYIKENKATYGIDKLRKGLLAQGIEYTEIKKAIQFIDDEEERKIASFISESENADIKEDSVLGDDFGVGRGGAIKKKADDLINTISTSVGGSKKMGKLYVDIFKYGAISFLFFSTIVYFFKYLGGAFVYPRIVGNLGVFSHLAIPDVFLVQFTFWDLVLKLVWSIVLGGILTVIFMKFLAKVWPFSNWFKLQQKVFFFYVIYEFIVSIIINGVISSLSWVYLAGYLIVIVGIVIGAYLSSNYLTMILENKYEDQIRQFTR